MPTSPDPAMVDLAVIGAGPAGLAAATAAARAGLRVALLDAAPRTGGQYWRHRDGDDGRLHHDWQAFVHLQLALEGDVRAGRILHRAGHQVWHVERTPEGPGTAASARFTVHSTAEGVPHATRARGLVIATGAYDRQLPFPGWTLPGVMAAGGVQALLKGHGVAVGKRVVVAGTGPFLLPVAAGLAEAGARVIGVFEAGNPLRFARHPLTLARNAGKLGEGAGYLRTFLRHRIPYRTGMAVVRARGAGTLQGVTVARLDRHGAVITGTEREIAADTLAVGFGFTPMTEIALQAGCAMRADADGSLVAVVDRDQLTSVPFAWAAGEVTGVGGAPLALAEGEIAGIRAAAALAGRAADRGRLRTLGRARGRGRAFGRALAAAFPVPAGWTAWLTDETLLCRCEEVPVARVREAVETLGADSARSAKILARPGMGLCQGRVCGYATASYVAGRCGRALSEDDLRGIAGRPIAAPITLGALAAGDDPSDGTM